MTWIIAATTSRNGKIEPRTASMSPKKSVERTSERASKWCDSSSQSCTRLYSIGQRRQQITTDHKLLTTAYRRSIRTSVLPDSVNVDVDVVISICSRRVMLFLLLLAIA